MEDSKQSKAESVQVVVRCRPLSRTERENNNQNVVEIDSSAAITRVLDPSKGPPKEFSYDAAFPINTTQEDLYVKAVSKIVDFVMQGFNGTIFAYGQTGTGKTFTMEGDLEDPQMRGVTPRAFAQIFDAIATQQSRIQPGGSPSQFLVSCQFVEIYQEDVMDLLIDDAPRAGAPRPHLALKENADGSVFVAGAAKHVVKSAGEMLRLLERGKRHRAVGATDMNAGSSRSHCIFTIVVETCETRDDGESHIRVGKLNLVDLAGSERQGKTHAQGERFKEAIKINLSLTCLGHVISSLTSRTATHTPYRNSKLTRLLQDSLGGNSKTVMIANIGPADYNRDETIETLRFASRAKLIKNKPKINEDPKDAMLREYQDEISRLRKALELAEAAEGGDEEAARELAALSLAGANGEAGVGLAGGPVQVIPRVSEQVKQVGISKGEIEEAERKAEQRRQEIHARHENERAQLEAQKEELSSKAAQYEQEVAEKAASLEAQKKSRASLAAQLQILEQRLRMDKAVIEEAKREGRVLEQRRAELARETREAEQRKQLLAQQEEEFMQSLSRKAKGEEDLSLLKKKLTKLRAKYKETKAEIEDQQATQNKEREDLMEELRNLSKHLQFQDLLLAHFVPNEQSEMIAARAIWDEGRDNYVMQPFNFKQSNLQEKRPPSTHANSARPVSTFEQYHRVIGDQSLRFANANILPLQLDPPDRTTQDWADLRSAMQEKAAASNSSTSAAGRPGTASRGRWNR